MRVLIATDAVTLAHSARASTLAEGLAKRGHEVVAAGVAPMARFAAPQVVWRDLVSIGPQRFTRALASGAPPFRVADLRNYIDEERRLIDAVKPDVIVTDFRPTAVMSARAAGIRSATLINAYWSPAARGPLPMPVLPGTSRLPLRWAQGLYDLGSRFVMPAHCKPWNQARRELGQSSLGKDLCAIYCDGDVVLYADVPGMFDLGPMAPTHHFVGPLLWSPTLDEPAWWRSVPASQPAVYVTLGSSGSTRVLERVVAALTGGKCSLMVSSAGADTVAWTAAPNTFAAPYIDGSKASQRADLVVCNGGSMSCQQAFAFGKPVLGIASNMDQFLNMQGVVAAGAGLCLRADRVTPAAVREACHELLHNPRYAAAAKDIGQRQAKFDAIACIEALLVDAAAAGTKA
jgi:UDP:flavonoid glycosyltransferase YjiC (YdhE family)